MAYPRHPAERLSSGNLRQVLPSVERHVSEVDLPEPPAIGCVRQTKGHLWRGPVVALQCQVTLDKGGEARAVGLRIAAPGPSAPSLSVRIRGSWQWVMGKLRRWWPWPRCVSYTSEVDMNGPIARHKDDDPDFGVAVPALPVGA